MNSNELLKKWAVEVLRERGRKGFNEDNVSITLETELDGCCEICYTEVAVLVIKSGRVTETVTDFLFM